MNFYSDSYTIKTGNYRPDYFSNKEENKSGYLNNSYQIVKDPNSAQARNSELNKNKQTYINESLNQKLLNSQYYLDYQENASKKYNIAEDHLNKKHLKYSLEENTETQRPPFSRPMNTPTNQFSSSSTSVVKNSMLSSSPQLTYGSPNTLSKVSANLPKETPGDYSPKNQRVYNGLERIYSTISPNNAPKVFSKLNRPGDNGQIKDNHFYHLQDTSTGGFVREPADSKLTTSYQSPKSINITTSSNSLKFANQTGRLTPTDQPHKFFEGSLLKINNVSPSMTMNKANGLAIKANNSIPTLKNGSHEHQIGMINYTLFKDYKIPSHEPTKTSSRKNGIIKAYAVNTNQGIVRNYNEDRVSIILNINKPKSRGLETWPKCSFFGIYDGHGGVNCADFLKENLHQYVIKDQSFPSNPKEAIRNGFQAAEKQFLEWAQNQPNNSIERSGSCAIVVLIVGETCYVANVGDSRAVMSGEKGSKVYPLSKDHKPLEENEHKRITDAGGKIYQTRIPTNGTNPETGPAVLGPYRVLPGRLSVTRTFGDIEAKFPRFGGNLDVVIAVPDIKSFKIAREHDFIVLASDGIYDKMTSKEVIESVWETTKDPSLDNNNIHSLSGNAIESIMKCSLARKTLDNITVAIIAFKNFKSEVFPKKIKTEESDRQEKASPPIKRPMTASAYMNKLKNDSEIRLDSNRVASNTTNLNMARSLVFTRTGGGNPTPNSFKGFQNDLGSSSLQNLPSKLSFYQERDHDKYKSYWGKSNYENELTEAQNIIQTKANFSRSQEFKGF